jgi:hypothetical protein
MRRILVLLICLSMSWPVLAHADEGGGDQGDEIDVGGTFTTHVVPCETLCTESSYHGSLVGTSNFTLISLDPTADPNVVRYVGNLVLHTADGDLIGVDVGLWNLATGKYTDSYQVTSGTGIYTSATGLLRLRGTLDATTGTGSSRYDGTITFPD